MNIIAQIAYRRKAIAAAGAALVVTAAVVADRTVTTEEALTLLSAWGAVFGVHQITNGPKP